MSNPALQNSVTMSGSSIRKAILDFSYPIVAELMLMSLIAMVNLSMVGHLGAYALSAVGLTNQPVFISLAVFQSFNIGATALISRLIGAKEYREVKGVVIQTLLMAVVLGLVLTILGVVFAKPIVVFLGAQADTVNPATMYMRYMAVGMLFQAIPTAVTSIFRGAGESKIPMRYNIVSNVINAAAGFALIYGCGLWEGFGLHGAAVATTLAKLAACVMSLYALFHNELPICISWRDRFRLDGAIIKRIMRIGTSAAGEALAMRIGFLLYTKIIADLGTVPLAAHQVVLNVTQFASNIINGLAVAASSYTGRFLGAQNPGMAEEYSKEITRMGLVFSLVMGSCFVLAGRAIARIYTADITVIGLVALVLKIAALITVPQNYLSIISGSLRGAGDTKWPLVSSVIGMVVARVSLAAVFVKVFHWGLPGAWMAAVADQSIRSVLIYYRFKSGKWKQIQV